MFNVQPARLLGVAAGLLLLGAAAAACQPLDSAASAGKVCDTRPAAPYVTNEMSGGPRIVGETVSTCDHAPDTHVVTLSVERKTPDGWHPVIVGGEPWGQCRDIPRPGHAVRCQWLVKPCINGTYRTVAHVSGTGQTADGNYTSFSYPVPQKPEALIVCRL